MLYELIAVVRPGNLSYIKEIARTTGRQILQNKGVIRGITNWGQFDLPRPTTKHQTQHHMGHYFIIQFDAPISTQQEIKRTLGLDPRMIRSSIVKIGDKLGGKIGAIEIVTGRIHWNTLPTGASDEFMRNRTGQGMSQGSDLPFGWSS